jgi:dethiobiotin synthetase
VRGCLIAGTGTGVGKTVLTASLAASLRAAGRSVGAFKPIVTGTAEPTAGWPDDHELLAAVTGQTPQSVCPLTFGPPMSPHLAARLAGVTIEPARLLEAARRTAASFEVVLVEGVGGLLVPLATDYSVRDFAADLGLPVVVAAQAGLGTINHTLLTVESARAAGLDVRAVVIMCWPQQPSEIELSNRSTIASAGEVDVFTLSTVERPEPDLLAAAGRSLAAESWIG